MKIGAVSINKSVRGLLVECEYLPCFVASQCWELIRELLEPLLGGFSTSNYKVFFKSSQQFFDFSTNWLMCFTGVSINQPNPYLAPRMNELYTPVDTIQQYMDHFNALRRGVANQSLPPSQGGPNSVGSNQNPNQQIKV